MSNLIELDLLRHQRALAHWLDDCNRRMNLKFPGIEFESDDWPIRTLYKTKQADFHFQIYFAYFKSKERDFCQVLRGLVAEHVIKGKPKIVVSRIRGFCLLAQIGVQSIFEITLKDLRPLEDACLLQAREHPPSANETRSKLAILKMYVESLAAKGVIPWIGFCPRHEVKAELIKIAKHYAKREKTERYSILDHKIEAFNEALNALYVDDSRLSPADRMVIAISTRLMCAPSRINEILCSSINDHVTVEDYAQKSAISEFDVTHRAHQMLLITTKGSKGASWSAKPALHFMIDAFEYTTEVIKQLGQRSRALIKWYQHHPNTLYLSPEFEDLRSKDLSCRDLAQIIYLTKNPSEKSIKYVRELYFVPLKHIQIRKKARCRCSRWFLPFKDVEHFLLQKVKHAMGLCRKVTGHNHYQGDLSKMLCLFDAEETPFLPRSLNYRSITRRLKRETAKSDPTLFEKLGITMPANGKVEVAWIEMHDPRRWLTTQALRHGEKLSDVLINKWANRLNLAQLKPYDMRSDEELASFSKMPIVKELDDISRGIDRANKLEEKYGLQSEIVAVPDANICVTSMDQVLETIGDRPVARTSEQVIILYPSQFGVCLHQHHETPCRNYDSCLPCDSNAVVKGHIFSNDKVRNRAKLLHTSIIRQMDRLVMEHNRGIADEPESLVLHILTLVEKGLDSEQMADYLIDEFHQIKDMVEDKLLVKRLEEAFVARGFVNLLDDQQTPNGALMKYHNPTYHAAPGLEKALDSHGGREKIQQDEQTLIKKYPQFAPKALHLKDERHLLTAEGEDFEE